MERLGFDLLYRSDVHTKGRWEHRPDESFLADGALVLAACAALRAAVAFLLPLFTFPTANDFEIASKV